MLPNRRSANHVKLSMVRGNCEIPGDSCASQMQSKYYMMKAVSEIGSMRTFDNIDFDVTDV